MENDTFRVQAFQETDPFDHVDQCQTLRHLISCFEKVVNYLRTHETEKFSNIEN
jgi:hypothetical protein